MNLQFSLRNLFMLLLVSAFGMKLFGFISAEVGFELFVFLPTFAIIVGFHKKHRYPFLLYVVGVFLAVLCRAPFSTGVSLHGDLSAKGATEYALLIFRCAWGPALGILLYFWILRRVEFRLKTRSRRNYPNDLHITPPRTDQSTSQNDTEFH